MGKEQSALSCYWLDLLLPVSSHIQLTHCALLFLHCPFCLPQTHAERIKTVLDDLKYCSPPHHFSAADMLHLCCSSKRIWCDCSWRQSTGLAVLGCLTKVCESLTEQSRAGLGHTSGTELEENTLELALGSHN